MSGAADRLELCEAILSLIERMRVQTRDPFLGADRKSTRLNSSHHG